MSLESLISLGFYLSGLGFFIASIVCFMAKSKVGKSALGSVLSYLFIGTGVFFAITIFQGLGAEHFGIPDESMDFWWHIMFYLAMMSYYLSFKSLTKLGMDEPAQSGMSKETTWGIFSLIVLVLVFILPGMTDAYVGMYMSSPASMLGLHHFIAFAFAGTVGIYLLNIKKNLGQIGQAIAGPMLIATFAFALQHFWELLNESWKVVVVTSDVGEGGEKIFLIIAAVCVTVAALRLKRFATGS